ncbi:ABC transporter ATP-binding protein [Kibdelosporangium philippinense]|uniref:ABC transporter ATP-binding protein n=1 Tax=Kibdelosporangium philippinense TaxID=211113 RepID=A0ABS8Z7J0_9PSEU|nr:ABC transporter ATP-binding protein [Kibdelosporangium philippinense]MCE7003855.1 ABC transporter ATP-binding protein [Kibdelosporangium philippinense]
MDQRTVAVADQLGKVYGTGQAAVTALGGVSAQFRRGEFTAVMGPSGSGKSTFMHCLASLDTPTSGRAWIGGVDLSSLSEAKLTRLRRDKIGFIFQSFNLLPTLTAWENIVLPLSLADQKPDPVWTKQVIDAVGLADRLTHRPAELSGGQQQRVACARALVSRPELIVADEPTGNLDSRTGAQILGLLQMCARQWGQTVVMVTHDPLAAGYADRVLFLADGRLVDEMAQPTADRVLDRMRRFDAQAVR